MAASRTNAMLTLWLAAVLALGNACCRERMMRTTLVADGLRCFSFGYSHNTTHEKIKRAPGTRWLREQFVLGKTDRNASKKNKQLQEKPSRNAMG